MAIITVRPHMVVIRITLANRCKSFRIVPGIWEVLSVSSLFIFVVISTEKRHFPKGGAKLGYKR